jgi:ribonuclease VapC
MSQLPSDMSKLHVNGGKWALIMTSCVLDASSVLAFLFEETGHDIVRPLLRGGLISSVTAGEVIFRTYKNGKSIARQVQEFRNLEMHVIDFDLEQAATAASFKANAGAANLSCADRACLANEKHQSFPIVTAEEGWLKVKELDIRLIRQRNSPDD